MEENPVVIPLSDAISGGIAKVYTLGGLGLTFVFIGSLFLLTSALSARGPVSYTLAGVGLALILAVLVLFYQREIRPVRNVHRAVTANAELVDSVQETALEMTALANDLQALAFKYASEIEMLVTGFQEWARESADTSLLRALPGASTIVERFVENEYTEQAVDLSATIVSTTEATQQVIADVETALAHSDPEALKRYIVQIQKLDRRVKGVLGQARA